ncbi:hypothetical protein OHA98_16020 [Streptomyces sp. NBC_00654]|uniref:hypothetical protein n=1 Tax=Streptomyces sp. NBC_00654 TaxID=2975799 RepID=UPI00224DB286|nr:hypothetical protein [Streptomyces sp. NBC_00654]MCX4966318.1 hypothetical protein [Streptomyces sp. NBC_00654]
MKTGRLPNAGAAGDTGRIRLVVIELFGIVSVVSSPYVWSTINGIVCLYGAAGSARGYL